MTLLIRSAGDFGRAVRDRRRALGLTQEQLARRCGVGKRFIVELEAGKPTSQLGKALTAASEVGLLIGSDRSPHPPAGTPAPAEDGGNDPLSRLPRF